MCKAIGVLLARFSISQMDVSQTPVLHQGYCHGISIMFVVISEIGNFYHHKLLAWLGTLLLSRHLFTLLAFVAMLGYLSARSIKIQQRCRQHFPDYPAGHKNMIPFLF